MGPKAVVAEGPGREGPRHEAREQALALLYEAELKHVSLPEVMAGLAVVPDPFTVSLVTGVDAEGDEVDRLIAAAAVGWEIGRMPVVDRTILRLATWELMARPDVPVAVVIDEAVELAKQYSTEESGGFVNGVLSTIARRVRPPRGAPDAAPGGEPQAPAGDPSEARPGGAPEARTGGPPEGPTQA